jgi:putative ABC transport system ATP-binding protein
MGPSGSGKSTLLNIVGCLDRPTSGHFKLLGQDISRTSDDELARLRREELGFIFQTFNLIGRIS